MGDGQPSVALFCARFGKTEMGEFNDGQGGGGASLSCGLTHHHNKIMLVPFEKSKYHFKTISQKSNRFNCKGNLLAVRKKQSL